VTGCISEARNLFGLGQQVKDRVEAEVDEGVLTRRFGGGHVAHDHWDGRLVHLGPELVDHRGETMVAAP